MTFSELLSSLVGRGASDIHMHAGLPMMARIHGKLSPVTQSPLTPQYTEALVEMMCNERQKLVFSERNQVDLAYSVPGVARFRVNLFRQRGSVSCVMRVVNSDEDRLKIVSLPQETLQYFRDQEKGLVLVTGPTGSGKSTTLARIIDEINQQHAKMIITLEDPIEYLHRSKKSIVVQREIGQDVPSFKDGLVAAMRQDPDVIMIGEIRDHATAAAALEAAQTGHLVFSTLHTLDAVRTVNRVLDLFPPHERNVARILFAESLVGIVSQRLLPSKQGGRVCAMEILKGTLRIRDLIKDPERTHEIYQALKDSSLDGMQTFDDHLAELYARDQIDLETALAHATSAQYVKVKALQINAARQTLIDEAAAQGN
ncbi:Twitching mobility protein [Meiothermus luteus]|jgi:twitching motility protein PilT|uniref:Twitching mobility protein n=1 Tax=Meiothermus luteus TaxID=2026184 RepID=A0A399F2W3_9DEIN|nr:PilT/PilU family type 4a pilus ATPase [Meiothermus luteus]RIH90016.1 Twitching mobility protein [Meiothermus luteus]RMH53515.1 MAG: PilT/PilU family type 4a pilus ATPase [Deinococcota bacterium]